MLGLLFYNCNPFGFSIRVENCNLSHSSFFELKIKKTTFNNTKLVEVDFTTTDLSFVEFLECNLTSAQFENSNLGKADFRTAFNYSNDPELNWIKKARFSLPAVIRFLNRFDIEIENWFFRRKFKDYHHNIRGWTYLYLSIYS